MREGIWAQCVACLVELGQEDGCRRQGVDKGVTDDIQYRVARQVGEGDQHEARGSRSGAQKEDGCGNDQRHQCPYALKRIMQPDCPVRSQPDLHEWNGYFQCLTVAFDGVVRNFPGHQGLWQGCRLAFG
ncbi:MAG: hypothetical protein R3C44_10485 [Chloroflexota bacterium]